MPRRPLRALSVCVVLLAAAPSAAASVVPTSPPMVLPGTHAARAVAARSANGLAAGWIVGGAPGARTRALAAHYDARLLTDLGSYLVPTAHARAFARALRAAGALQFAEPNVRERRAAFESNPSGWSRGAIATSTLAVPPLTGVAAGIVDQQVDTTRPDLANTAILPGSVGAVEGPHGTEGASVIGAAADGQGILGTFPGIRINAYGVPLEFGCADSVAGIRAVSESGAVAINMSYGSTEPCFAEYRELQYALGNGVVAVAASGNEFQEGNPVSYPAALPHVLSVAAVDPNGKSSDFSTANAAVDLAAPGEAVPVDIPLAFDIGDGQVDGFGVVDGTSFAAPAVTGAAAFVKAARPQLTAGQVADVLRASAIDVDAEGYDANTGYGLVNLDRAVVAPAPRIDPLEPNDEIMWVSGAAFTRPDRAVFDGRRPTFFTASVDQVEDPLDVYRVKVGAHSNVRVTLRPSSGDPDLEVFRSTAKSTDDSARLIDASRRNGTLLDASTLTNSGSRPSTVYVAVRIDPRVQNLAASYRLTVRRLAR